MDFTIADVHWTAGFLEGDGYFTLNNKSPRIGSSQAELFPLQKLVDLWGGTVRNKKANIGTKALHEWAFGGQHSVGLMMMVYELMTPSRQSQIRAVLDQWKRNNFVGRGEGHYRTALSNEEALQAMQDVLDGEPVTQVASRVGISHASLIGWLSGERRPSLLRKLQGRVEVPPRVPSPVFAQTLSDALVCSIHYSAGFLEAEGCFSAYSNMVRLQGIQADTTPLKKLQQLWGGAIYQRKSVAGRKPVLAWHLNGPNAVGLMMAMYPLMSPSRQGQIAKALGAWKLRKVQYGATHYDAVATDEEALAAMRHLRDGRSYEVVAQESGISRWVLGMWMRGRNRPYLRERLEAEGKPSVWQYNGGRKKKVVIDTSVALQAIRRVRSGEARAQVAADLGVIPSTVGLWCSGSERPTLLAQVLQEEQSHKEEQLSWIS